MRIVYLSASGKLGGAERVLLDLLATLRQSEPEWELRLFAPAAGPLTEHASNLGVTVVVLPFPARLAALGVCVVCGEPAYASSAAPHVRTISARTIRSFASLDIASPPGHSVGRASRTQHPYHSHISWGDDRSLRGLVRRGAQVADA
jgi:hypothetical protein